MSEYENLRTADIIAEALLDWKVEAIFGLRGDGINGFLQKPICLDDLCDEVNSQLLAYELDKNSHPS